PTMPASPAARPSPSASGGGPAGGPGKRRKALILGLGLLLVAGAGTGGWLLWGRDGHGGQAPAKKADRPVDAKLEWMAAVPNADKGDSERLGRPWFTGDKVVMPTKKDVTAYDATTGRTKWTVHLPGYACNRSPGTDGGVGVVVYGKQEFDCDMLMAVDLEHGREMWSRKLADYTGKSQRFSDGNISVANGRITLSYVGDPMVYSVQGDPLRPYDYGCEERGTVVQGSHHLTLAQCDLFGRQFVMDVDPKSGLENWTWKVLDGLEVQNVLSVHPAVLTVGRDHDTEPSDIVSLDPDGRMNPLISASAGPYQLSDCWKNDLTSCHSTVADGNTLYLATRDDRDNADGTRGNTVAAVDLATGKPRWTSDFGGSRVSRPVAMHDGHLLVYQQATSDESGLLLSVDPANGKSSVLMRLPQESAEREYALARSGSAYFHDGHLYLVAYEVMGEHPMIMSFR
ncbi:PQQ-binding-like beta-propeller repeat protein, partial [Streptomyces sp. NPDC049577]|uniref:outer membrane protein assembly factor BamB family protein n=1 Tax=Streptomyces sp. NPDC049577 TaxID=3155153 RepID=UPI00343ECB69